MKHCYLAQLLAIGTNLLLAVPTYAQEGILQKDTTLTGAITFLKLSTNGDSRRAASELGPVLRNLLKLRNQDELRPQNSRKDELGFTHTWHAQFYKGIPVEYGVYVAHSRNGAIESLNGEVVKIGALDAAANLSEKDALAKALATIGAKTYRWQVPADEANLKALKTDPEASYYPVGTLLVSRDEKAAAGARLAYKFAVYAQQPNSATYVYVDAHSGEVFRRLPIAQDSNAPATAATRYSGIQAITTDLVGSNSYRLRETSRGSGAALGSGSTSIETYNGNGNGIYPPASASDITNSTTNWSGDVALDAHWAAEKTYDYYRNTFGRNSFDDAGSTIKIYTHCSSADDASWDPHNMYVALADGTHANPFTALDIVSHEISHAYTQQLINSDTSLPEPYAMNEGLSDIWSSCVEFFAAPNKQTWLSGEDIIKAGSGFTCVRNLANPNTGFDPYFINYGAGYPDAVQGPRFDTRPVGGGFDPHINSTIISHCFYLISVGGNSTNSLGNAYNITGIGIDKAAKILFYTEVMGYITSQAGYSSVRSAMIRSAVELFGTCSSEVAATTNAWSAVGVGAPLHGIISTPNITAIPSSNPGDPTTYDFVAPAYTGTDVAYNWYVNNVFFETITTDNVLRYYFPCRQTKTITCTITSCTGTTSQSNGIAETGGCSRTAALSFAPNPTASELVVQGEDPDTSSDTASAPFEAQLYNGFGQLVTSGHSQRGKVRLNVQNLPNGLYTLRAGTGETSINEHIQISH
jgi:Zn-dependent metalloprotease